VRIGESMQIPEIFRRCEQLTMSKRRDYTTNHNVDNHENFKRSAMIAEWFTNPVDKPYAVLIATKLARLASLRSSGRIPNNESIEDSFLDLINYAALWMERVSEDQNCYKETDGYKGEPSNRIDPVIEQQNQIQMNILRLVENLNVNSLKQLSNYFLETAAYKQQNEVEINASPYTAEHRHQTTNKAQQQDSLYGTHHKNPDCHVDRRNSVKGLDSL
jgi:hypothetical protein